VRKWKGPCEILAKINGNTYEVKPKYVRGKKLVMNQSRLAKCFTRDYLNVRKQILSGDNVTADVESPKTVTEVPPSTSSAASKTQPRKSSIRITRHNIPAAENRVGWPANSFFEVDDDVALADIPPELAQMRASDRKVTFEDIAENEGNDECLLNGAAPAPNRADTIDGTEEAENNDEFENDESSYRPNYYYQRQLAALPPMLRRSTRLRNAVINATWSRGRFTLNAHFKWYHFKLNIYRLYC